MKVKSKDPTPNLGMKLDLVDGKRSLQLVQKGLPIGVIAEDRLAFIPATRDVIVAAGNLYP